MVKVSREQAAANRARILGAAARLFRERGLGGVGVDTLTEAAGLTHGSLYSRFGSKDRLAAEAMAAALAEGLDRMLPTDPERSRTALAGLPARYLSARHRDAPGGGCAFAALGSEVPRQSAAVRAAFTTGLRAYAARLAPLLPGDGETAPEDAALDLLASLAGALMLARAVDDPALSERILAATRRRLDATLHAGDMA